MGGKSDGPDQLTQTVTQEASIPSFLRPFVTQSADVASGALGQLGTLADGSLVAPFVGDQLAAFGLARGLALGPDSPLSTAISTVQDAAAGGGFSSDAFQNAYDATVRRNTPGALSPFLAAGEGSSGLADVAREQVRADAFAGLYNQERQRQLAAASALPALASAPIGLLGSIGDQQQAQAQQEIQAPISMQQMLLSGALGGLPIGSLIGRTGTTTQPLYQNELGQALGLGIGGVGLLDEIGLAGGITGLLGGIF